jgi:hypothetical protein
VVPLLLRYFLKYFEVVPVALLFLVPILLLHSICAVFLLSGLSFWTSSQLLSHHTSISWNCNILYPTRPFFTFTNYNVRFIVRDGSEGLHSLIP